MKKIFVIIVVMLVIAAGVVFFIQRPGVSKPETDFKFEVLKRGDLKNIVSSTGTLSAVGTVVVGSQISGTLSKVLVDYNDKVKKGQLLAVVDPTMLDAAVRDAEANVAKANAQLQQAQTEYQRNEKLYQDGYVSEITYLAGQTSVATAKAGLQSAEAALKRAQTNLKYTQIYSPITGTVIERSVEAGQTIAASMNAPTLFTIAEDLARMQIEAAVDESDIGQIKEGMPVRFTVQAYPDEEFTGVVRQIRLKPVTIQDVVNYTVVVNAANERGLLLPGMTATVDFLIEERQDVLLVPNTALYFQPPQELITALRQQSQDQSTGRQRDRAEAGQFRDRSTGRQGDRTEAGPHPSDDAGEQVKENGSSKMGRIVYLDDAGKPHFARFVSGATDGTMTEVVQSAQLQEGVRVVTGTNTPQPSSTRRTGGFPFPH